MTRNEQTIDQPLAQLDQVVHQRRLRGLDIVLAGALAEPLLHTGPISCNATGLLSSSGLSRGPALIGLPRPGMAGWSGPRPSEGGNPTMTSTGEVKH